MNKKDGSIKLISEINESDKLKCMTHRTRQYAYSFHDNLIKIAILTLREAISETLRCVCTVSSCSKHHSSSSIVSIAKRT